VLVVVDAVSVFVAGVEHAINPLEIIKHKSIFFIKFGFEIVYILFNFFKIDIEYYKI
jgi:hypothetical protein